MKRRLIDLLTPSCLNGEVLRCATCSHKRQVRGLTQIFCKGSWPEWFGQWWRSGAKAFWHCSLLVLGLSLLGCSLWLLSQNGGTLCSRLEGAGRCGVEGVMHQLILFDMPSQPNIKYSKIILPKRTQADSVFIQQTLKKSLRGEVTLFLSSSWWDK